MFCVAGLRAPVAAVAAKATMELEVGAGLEEVEAGGESRSSTQISL